MKNVGGKGSTLRKPTHMVFVPTKPIWYKQRSNQQPLAPEVSAILFSHRGLPFTWVSNHNKFDEPRNQALDNTSGKGYVSKSIVDHTLYSFNTYRLLSLQLGWFAHPIFSEKGDYPPVMRKLIDTYSFQEGRSRSRLPRFTRKEIKYIRGRNRKIYSNISFIGFDTFFINK